MLDVSRLIRRRLPAEVTWQVGKTRVEDLACFGGAPAFDEALHVGMPNIGSRPALMQRLEDIFDRRRLTNNGPYVQAFEKEIAGLTGARHCIAVCNATVGLEIAIRAAGLAGEVIVPSFTFIATAHALQWQEIRPVFCDIDPASHTIDPAQVEALITPRTTGILAVHLWGNPCQVEALQAIADRHRLKLLFDAAHAFGNTHAGVPVGNFGDAEVFSFHATKFINALEGGAVVTNNDELALKVRLMKNFGFAGYDHVVYLGTNGKMNEISAAMGLTSLESLDEIVATNVANYRLYRQALAGIPGLTVKTTDENERRNYQYVIVELESAAAGLTRDCLIEVLRRENVLARRYFYPGCHRMEPYRSMDPGVGMRLPVTERVSERVLALPTGTGVSPQAVEIVAGLVRFIVEHARQINTKIERDGFCQEN